MSFSEKKRSVAIVRYTPYWCHPEFSVDPGDLPENTQGYLLKKEDGDYEAMWPIPVSDTKEHGYTEEKLYLTDSDPYRLLDRLAEKVSEKTGIPLRKDRKYPEVFEYLGWCTWDAMEIWVNEDGVIKKCEEFTEKQVPVRWVILDDMWADVAWKKKLPMFTPHEISFEVMHASKLRNIEADAERFPCGLSRVIDKIHDHSMKAGIWHTIQGYWSGIEKDSPAYELLKEYLIENPEGLWIPDLTDPEKTNGFFQTIHAKFKNDGADFVKIDNQSSVERFYGGVLDTVLAAKNLNAAIDRSVNTYFDGALINCMGMGEKNLLARPSSCISRASDDFQPENRAWFAKHIQQCAFNGLFQGRFYVNDWDMWWTDDGQAVKNSVLRAISGGPIYISDRDGRTNPEILRPLCLSDGRILRCDDVLVPVSDCLFDDPTISGRAFSVFNRADEVVYMGSFNLSESGRKVSGTIRPSDFGFMGRTVIFGYFGKEKQIIDASASYDFELENPDDFELFMIAPVTEELTLHGVDTKMIGRKAVRLINADTVYSECDGTLYYSAYGRCFKMPVKQGENRLTFR